MENGGVPAVSDCEADVSASAAAPGSCSGTSPTSDAGRSCHANTISLSTYGAHQWQSDGRAKQHPGPTLQWQSWHSTRLPGLLLHPQTHAHNGRAGISSGAPLLMELAQLLWNKGCGMRGDFEDDSAVSHAPLQAPSVTTARWLAVVISSGVAWEPR